MRLAAGAAVAGTAYHAGKSRADQDQANDEAHAAYAATLGPSAAVPTDTSGEIEHLAQLHAAGSLTDDEFTAAKAKALGI